MSTTMSLPTLYKIFLIADDEFYRELIGSHLRTLTGTEITTYSTVQELPAESTLSPDVIILDEHYEDHGIEEVLSVMRLRYSEAPFFVLTSDSSTSHKLKLIQQGAAEVIVKDEHVCELLEHSLTLSLRTIQWRREHQSLAKRFSKNFILTGATSVQSNHSETKELTLEDYTMQIIQHYLARHDNNVVLVANKLGVGKSTIYRYLKDKKLQLSGIPSVRPEPVTTDTTVSGSYFFDNVASRSFSYTSRSVQELPVDLSDTESLVDINFLLRLARGNRLFLAGMMDVFLRSMDKLLHQLKHFQSVRDRHRVRKYLQKIKPTIDTLGMRTLKGFVVQTELMVEAEMDWSVIDNSLSEVYSLYSRCESAVREQKNKLQS